VAPAATTATSPAPTLTAAPSPSSGRTSPPPASLPVASPARLEPSPSPATIPADYLLHGVAVHGSRARPWVALTFDADMTESMLARLRSGQVASWYDPRIVEELSAAHAPATFFLTGLWAQTYPDVVRALAADTANELENHSFDHAAWAAPCYGLPTVSGSAAKEAEVLDAAEVITTEAATGPVYFRFPGGCHEEEDVQLVRSLGEMPVAWDVISGDSFNPDAAKVEATVLSQVQPGSIVVMHLMGAPNAPATADALKGILATLADRGYEFVTVRRMLAP